MDQRITSLHADEALATAQTTCEQRGVRLTPMRREVYRALLCDARPLTAYALLHQLSEQLSRQLAPPTVYRAIEFLLDQGMIHRIESMNAYRPCATPSVEHDAVFYICSECGKASEVNDRRVGNAIYGNADELAFMPTRQIVEVHGLCTTCAPELPL